MKVYYHLGYDQSFSADTVAEVSACHKLDIEFEQIRHDTKFVTPCVFRIPTTMLNYMHNRLSAFNPEVLPFLQYEKQLFDQSAYQQTFSHVCTNLFAAYDVEFALTLTAPVSEPVFIKSSLADQSIKTGIVQSGMSICAYIEQNAKTHILEGLILTSSVKTITDEYRVIMCDGEPISIVSKNNLPFHQYVIRQFINMHVTYYPTQLFVVDIALINGELSILEYNTFSSAIIFDMQFESLYELIQKNITVQQTELTT